MAHDPRKVNLDYVASATTNWGQANASQQQPHRFSTSLESMSEVDGWKIPKLTSRAGSSQPVGSFGLPNRPQEQGIVPFSQAQPWGRQDWQFNTESAPLSNRPAPVDAHRYKPPSDWSTGNGIRLNHSTSSAMQPLPRSNSPWAKQGLPQSGVAGENSTYSLSKQTGVEPADIYAVADRLLNSKLPSERFQAGPGSPYRSTPTPNKSAAWAPTENRIDVLKKVLPPYAAKTPFPGSHRGAYQSTLPNIGPAKPQKTSRATAAWQPSGDPR